MNIVQSFKINLDSSIETLVPDLKDKFNYYYEPTKQLHMFDEVTVEYKKKDKTYALYKDNLNVTLFDFKDSLESVLNNKNQLSGLDVGELGRRYNIDKSGDSSKEVNYSSFWVWSIRGMQTWLYNKNDKIYLEISPSYPWLFVEPEQGENYISFDEFIKNYRPIAIEEIDRSLACKWIDQVDIVLSKMIKV